MEKSVFQYKVAPKQVDFTRRLSVSAQRAMTPIREALA